MRKSPRPSTAAPRPKGKKIPFRGAPPPLSQNKCAICSSRRLRPPHLGASRLPTSSATCLPSLHFARWSFEEEGSKRFRARREALDLEKMIPFVFGFLLFLTMGILLTVWPKL